MRRCCTDCSVEVGKGKQRCVPCKRRIKAAYRARTKKPCTQCGRPCSQAAACCLSCAKKPELVPCLRCGTPHWPWRHGEHARKLCQRCIAEKRASGEAKREVAKSRPKRAKQSEKERRENNRLRAARKYKANPASERARAAAWKRRNPEKRNEWAHRRRARLRGGHVQPVDLVALHSSRKTCIYCGARRRLTVDHLEPISRGGAHARWNLVLACLACNSAKRDLPLSQWLPSLAPPRRAVVERLIETRRLNQLALPLSVYRRTPPRLVSPPTMEKAGERGAESLQKKAPHKG